MELLKKWQKKYSELNAEYLETKGMMTEREIYEVKSHLKSISSFIEDIQALRQPPVSGQSEQFICPCCGSNKTYKTDAIHCNRCAVTTEI